MSLQSETKPSVRQVRVGSWPGRSFQDNAFVGIFCDALDAAGAHVVDVRDPTHISEAIDVLQIHWAEDVFWRGLGRVRLLATLVATIWSIARMRRRGVKIFWLVHNLRPHDASREKRLLWLLYSRQLARLVDGYVSLSPATLPIIGRTFPFSKEALGIAVHHPRYAPLLRIEEQAAARGRLRLPKAERLLAFVGSILRYKGVGRLLSAAAECPPDRVALVIAGRASDLVLRAELAALAARASNVDFRPERLSDADFAALVQASDYVVLPFDNSLHSGSIVHALSLGRPVLTPATPFALELADAIGPLWVRTYVGELTPELLSTLPPPPEGLPGLGPLDPALLGRRLVEAYENRIDNGRSDAGV